VLVALPTVTMAMEHRLI